MAFLGIIYRMQKVILVNSYFQILNVRGNVCCLGSLENKIRLKKTLFTQPRHIVLTDNYTAKDLRFS